jgi:hypothetical protein
MISELHCLIDKLNRLPAFRILDTVGLYLSIPFYSFLFCIARFYVVPIIFTAGILSGPNGGVAYILTSPGFEF